MKTFEIIISGRVQRVGYRYFCFKVAERLGIKGYVENLLNGKVRIIITGEEEEKNLFIEELKKGPVFARVDYMDVDEIKLRKFSSFSIK
ncbi:MAG: acylphosphatase [Kosmotogales bacterium]|nr:acylphosphatase [Kosmotogales bacterium]